MYGWPYIAVQEDKDLVHEFVNRGGLDCLIDVGSAVDPNYQNYILRGIAEVLAQSVVRWNVSVYTVSFPYIWIMNVWISTVFWYGS